MSTVVEVELRMREFQRRIDAVRPHFDKMVIEAFKQLHGIKVPCIRYGKCKRKMRLAIPRGASPLPTPTIKL